MKEMILRLADASGFNSWQRRQHNGEVLVLMYHGVSKDEWGCSDKDWLQVKESEFAKQMHHLSRHYDVIRLSEAYKHVVVPDRSSKPKVVLTFDDGYANNLTVACPILERFRFPATVFVATAKTISGGLFWYDKLRVALNGNIPDNAIQDIVNGFKELHPGVIDAAVDNFITERGYEIDPDCEKAYQMLTVEQIHDLHDTGLIDIDSHTHRHEILARLDSITEADETITTSLNVISGLGIPCRKYFCYPNGWYGPEHAQLVKNLGFFGAVSTKPGWWTDPKDIYDIPRIGIGREMTINQFSGLLSGSWKRIADTAKSVKGALRPALAWRG